MKVEQLVEQILEKVGTASNISGFANCMTRLRLDIIDDSLVDEQGLKDIDGVLGLVRDKANYIEVVVGPGKSAKCAAVCERLGVGTGNGAKSSQSKSNDAVSVSEDWKKNKSEIKSKQKGNKLKDAFKTFGEIFVPLIPGVVAAGMCAGISAIIVQFFPYFATETDVGEILIIILKLINVSFMTYISAWAGYRTAERFGGTPILGGMLGLILNLDQVNEAAKICNLYDVDAPLNSILCAGRGGILAAVAGVWIMVKVEKFFRKHIPDSMSMVFVPLLTMLVCIIPFLFVIMPVMGFVSAGLCSGVQALCMSENIFVRMITGYVSAALFLPLVAMGMHHGLVALYTVQLQTLGYVTLYPALAMSGAGMVGAAIALYFKAKKSNRKPLMKLIKSTVPVGFLGVGEPLIYSVMIPLFKPFITAGLGAGFGGAFVMAMEVASTTWGPSGLLGFFVMTGGPNSVTKNMICYGIGLIISYIMGFIITHFAFHEKDFISKLDVKEAKKLNL